MQTGVIISCTNGSGPGNPYTDPNRSLWSVMFSYVLDAGGSQQGQVLVGYGSPVSGFTPTFIAPLWASPQATVAVPLNLTPGTSNQVLLPCPSIVQIAAFGISISKVN
jgi:hypothetical protein